MKPNTMKLIGLLALTLAVLFIPVRAQEALSLAPEKPEAVKIAERLDQHTQRMLTNMEFSLRAIYNELNKSGQQQAVLDLWGTSAAAKLTAYAQTRALLLQYKPTAQIPAPDPAVFVINQDGTVTYVAPPDPELPPQR